MRFLRHPFSEEDLTAYVDGEYSPAQQKRLEAHLGGCEVCGSFVRDALEMKAMLGGLQQETTDRSFFWPGAGAAAAPISRPARSLPVAMAAAAVAVVLLVSGAFALILGSSGGSTPGANTTAKGASPEVATPEAAAIAPMPSPVIEPPATSVPAFVPPAPTAQPAQAAPTRQVPPTPAQILTLPLGSQPTPQTPPRQPTQVPQQAFGLPPTPAPVPQQALSTPGGGGPSAATLSVPAAPVSGTLSVTPGGSVQVGKTVTICFTVSRPVQTRVLDQPPGQAAQVVMSDTTPGVGRCQSNLQVTLPLGTETFTLQYLEGANWVDLARATITVTS